MESMTVIWSSTSQPYFSSIRSSTSLCFSGSVLRCQWPSIFSSSSIISTPSPETKSSGMFTSPIVARPPSAPIDSMSSVFQPRLPAAMAAPTPPMPPPTTTTSHWPAMGISRAAISMPF